MKLFYKLAISGLFIGLFNNSYSQITIDSLSIFNDENIITATDSSFSFTIQGEGENLTWDFSQLTVQRVDTLVPLRPEETDFADEFPEATVAFQQAGIFLLFAADENGFVNLGAGGDVSNMDIRNNLSFHNTPADTILNLPLHYLDQGTYDCRGGSDFDVNVFGQDFSGRISHTVHRRQKVDAWGTITTPLGTYEALRVKEHTIMIDSVFVTIFGMDIYQSKYSRFDTTDVYSFYTQTDKESFLVATVDYNPDENKVNFVSWRNYLSSNSGVEKLSMTEQDISIYPNPSKGIFNIKSDASNFKTTVYNQLGQMIIEQDNAKEINLRNYPQGVYLVQIEGDNIHLTKKLILTR